MNTPPLLLAQLARHAADLGGVTAVTFLPERDPPVTCTFAQLAARVGTVAAWLRTCTRPGDRVVLLYPHGLDFVGAFLGCLAAGVIAVPAYPTRKNHKADRLGGIVRDCSPTCLLTTAAVRDTLPAAELGTPALVTDDLLPVSKHFDLRAFPGPDAIAFLQYTSGPMHMPRGVAITHGNIAADAAAFQSRCGHTENSVIVSWLSAVHNMGLVGCVLQAAYAGCHAVLLSPMSFLQSPARWPRTLSDFRATTTAAPSFAYDLCARVVTEDEKDGLDLSRLRVAVNGGEPVRAETITRFAKAFARCGFRPEAFFPSYGLTEATLFVVGGPPGHPPNSVSVLGTELNANRWMPADPADPDARTVISCGRPGDGVRVEIVDPATRRTAGPGVVGEIWVASAAVAGMYWDRPAETTEFLHAYLADTCEGPFLRTGDLGYLDDGALFITGRRKDMVIVRGRNLFPQDIERCIGGLPGLLGPRACAAYSMEGGGEERLAVAAETIEPLPVTPAQAITQVREAVTEEFDVAAYAITLVRAGVLPRTQTGEIDRCRCGRFVPKASGLIATWRLGQKVTYPLATEEPDRQPTMSSVPDRSGQEDAHAAIR